MIKHCIFLLIICVIIITSGCLSQEYVEADFIKYIDYGKITNFDVQNSFWKTSCTVETELTKAQVGSSMCNSLDITGEFHLVKLVGYFKYWSILRGSDLTDINSRFAEGEGGE